MSRVESRLRDLGLSLAALKPRVANYVGTKRSGDLLFVAGRVSGLRGEVGSEITTETARTGPSFTEHPAVLDGASDLLLELFGEAGRHARTATGAAQLPFGAAVQLDMVLRLAPE